MLLLKQEIKMIQTGLTKAKIEELSNLDLPEHTKFTLDQYIDQLELFNKQRTQLQSRLSQLL
jgi:hypothetical protein